MKKQFKVIIAFLIIAIVAVGVYFIFNKNNSMIVYDNIYALNYKIKDDDVNIVSKVDETIKEMLDIIDNRSLNVGDSQTSLQNFVRLSSAYTPIKNEILSYGNFCKQNNKAKQYLNAINKNYAKLKDGYVTAYNYLNNTYFKVDGTYSNATLETYIINFESLFKKVYPSYNAVYFNSSIAYALMQENMMLKNNAYKLKVDYVANLIDKFYADGGFNQLYLSVAKDEAQKLSSNFSQAYFENKTEYDNLFTHVTSLDISAICENMVTSQIDDYISALPTESERIIVQQYVELVARR